ncbi:polyhydroxyalkanoic acid synthase PhaR subunit [Scopulibacillus daqui]|uniref:Polyhydroxyalkanoic acid synthase PhaR subunit n=1 Tax=Scopulibacillus daqui TaxID=1469162 RepID=A0ABS2Q3U6_9BACL|nr:polyhydroxyalkanoic acid synthase subunit PhaR [Scopulibacillus daqui]MBM7646968.1 polyhydroxyalkanoic acid synthase PhaR subunit [Scopulibacillus daqui]
MSQQKNFDPFELWKEAYNQSESYWGHILDENMKEEYFSKWMGKVLESNLLFKKMMNQTTEGYLEQVNIPTRKDLSSVASLVVNVDEKIDSMEELIEGVKADNQLSETKLKNEIKQLNDKLDQVLSLLNEKGKSVNSKEKEAKQSK